MNDKSPPDRSGRDRSGRDDDRPERDRPRRPRRGPRSRGRQARESREERRHQRRVRERAEVRSDAGPAPARLAAYRVITDYDATGRFVADLIDDHLRTGRLSDSDRALVHEMAAGVVRHRRLVETVWKSRLEEGKGSPEEGLARLLSLGIYQLLFMAVPDHAAVHETVEIAKQIHKPKWVGFANGVLRSVTRIIAEERFLLPGTPIVTDEPEQTSEPESEAEAPTETEAVEDPPTTTTIESESSEELRPEAEPLSDAVAETTPEDKSDSEPEPPRELIPASRWSGRLIPLRDGEAVLLKDAVLPSPARGLAAWFGSAFSLPDWIAARWVARFDEETLLALGRSLGEPGPLTLRVNPLKSDRRSVLAWLSEWGAEAEAADAPQTIRVHGLSIRDLKSGLEEGLYSVQDESAMRAVGMLDPQSGERILDLCAGPGTKTGQIGERLANEGEIVACDITRIRVKRITENADRLGLENVTTALITSDLENVPDGPFDAVLVDAPCSNTGVLGKRPEVRWRLSPADLSELPVLQQRLLTFAVSQVKPGGRVCYSTCSIEPEENRDVVQATLESIDGLELVSEELHLPIGGRDGAYAALLRKSASVEETAADEDPAADAE